MEANNNNNAPDLVIIRDRLFRLFHTMFFRLSLAYARSCPRQLRRMLECFILLTAVLCLMMLVYIHLVYTRHPVQCLEHIKDSWPRHGILRVEVVKAAPPGYNIDHSYEKEKKLALRHRELLTDAALRHRELLTDADISDENLESMSEYGEYIVEYSLEIGFLRLSPAVRSRLNIPVHIEVLDPAVNQCFGDSFSRFILDNFFGYDDFLLSSIKSLAEKEDNKGYLRNVVTGAQYHFVSRWSSIVKVVAAAIVMMVFTISISMLLRYSQHQIFVMYFTNLIQMIEQDINITFLAAAAALPYLNYLILALALVGMGTIMNAFFEDITTTFYIILMVWLCDLYDAICCHTPITKRYWLRFFYLYHTAFYAYHHRFSGQYSGLALLTTWLFTQHSMLYFFHYYELPVILQQASRDHNRDAPAAAQDAATLQRQQEQQPPPPPHPEPAEEAVETPDPAVLRRYVGEVQASAMAVEQLEAEGRLSPPPTQPLLEDTEEEDWGSDEPTPREEEQPRAEVSPVGEQGTCSEKEKSSEDSSETKVNDDSNPSVHSNTVTGDNLNAGPTATVGDLSGACADINHLTEAVARGKAEHSAKEPAGKDPGEAAAAGGEDDQLVVIRQTELDEMRTNLRQASETLKSLRDSQ